MNKTNGFTLIELLIVMGIIGIITATAVPFFSNFIQSTHTKTTIEEIVSDLQTARILAVSTGEDATMKFERNVNSFEWSIIQDSKKISNKSNELDTLSISYIKKEFIFSSLGFLQDKNGNNISKNEITVCNIYNRMGGLIKINFLGKIELVEVSC